MAQPERRDCDCKTHFDLGYPHRIKDLIPHYRTRMSDQAIDIMDQCKDLPPDQQFAWTAPGWVMAMVLEDWPGRSPERKRRLDAYLAEGRFRIHALPFTLESDACEPGEMARGFSFSSKLARDHGMPLPVSGKMTSPISPPPVRSQALPTAFIQKAISQQSVYSLADSKLTSAMRLASTLSGSAQSRTGDRATSERQQDVGQCIALA